MFNYEVPFFDAAPMFSKSAGTFAGNIIDVYEDMASYICDV